MSMLTAQANHLREVAHTVERVKNDSVGKLSLSGSITLAMAAMDMRDAADTIDELRNRLTETCHDVSEPPKDGVFWPTPHFRCSKCGATHVSLEYVSYCPSCGRKVVG